MKKTLHFTLIIALIMLVAESKAQTTLLYYWNFNSLVTPATKGTSITLPVSSDSNTKSLSPGTINWELQSGAPNTATIGYIDNVSPGSLVNARGSALSIPDSTGNPPSAANPKSQGLRPRNPSEYAQLVFSIPTTGYNGIVIKFAVQTSSITSGIVVQQFDYSTDGGATYSSTGIVTTSTPQGAATNQDSVTDLTTYSLVTVDLTAATAVNNAGNLIFRIRYEGANNTGTSGNDRIDNVTVEGTASVTGVSNPSAADAGYSLYPNPTSEVVYLSAPTTSSKYITVYNAQGQPVYTSTVSGQQSSLSIAALTSGIYYVTINDNGTNYSIKFSKN